MSNLKSKVLLWMDDHNVAVSVAILGASIAVVVAEGLYFYKKDLLKA